MTLNEKVRDYKGLTPVEFHNGIYYKRDDLFEPYLDTPITGGKVRQCISLVETNLEHIIKDCDSTIATTSNIESPQGIIIARVAKEFNLHNILAIGVGSSKNGTESILNNPNNAMVRGAKDIGAEVLPLARFGYTSALYAKLEELKKTRKFFTALFGINVDKNFDSILGTTIQQTYNLPLNEVNKIVVPVGSALMYSAILIGLEQQGWLQNPNNQCVGVQISNINRLDTIKAVLSKKYFMKPLRYKQILDHTYSYHTHVKDFIYRTDIRLDPIYEAKAHQYAIKNKLLEPDDKSLYWVVGNSLPIRQKYGEPDKTKSKVSNKRYSILKLV